MARGRYQRRRLNRDSDARWTNFLGECRFAPNRTHTPVIQERSIEMLVIATDIHLRFTSICRHCFRPIELAELDQWWLRPFLIEEEPVQEAG